MISLSSLLLRKIHYVELLYLSVSLFVVTMQWDFYLFNIFNYFFAKFATFVSNRIWLTRKTNKRQTKQDKYGDVLKAGL